MFCGIRGGPNAILLVVVTVLLPVVLVHLKKIPRVIIGVVWLVKRTGTASPYLVVGPLTGINNPRTEMSSGGQQGLRYVCTFG